MRKISLFLSVISFAVSILLTSVFFIKKSKTTQDMFQESLTSIVEVKAFTGDIESFGTAVIVSNTELITNFHVVSYTNHSITYIHTNIEIRFSNQEEYQTVEMKNYDSELDLSLLVILDLNGKSFEINSSKVTTGQQVFLLGNGNNLGISITSGIISRSEVYINFNGNLNRYIQIDATSSNGVSGGAVLDENGEIIGVITLRLLDKNGVPIYGYVYAIPIEDVLKFWT